MLYNTIEEHLAALDRDLDPALPVIFSVDYRSKLPQLREVLPALIKGITIFQSLVQFFQQNHPDQTDLIRRTTCSVASLERCHQEIKQVVDQPPL